MEPETHKAEEQAERAHILIVEDEVAIAENLQEILNIHGYGTSMAHNPQDAIAAVGRRRPDLILMDINLGADIDGIETARRIRQSTDVPVVFLTAFSDDETVERAKQVDPMGYLVKPFKAPDVLTTVNVGLSSFRIQQEARRKASRLEAVIERMPDGMVFADADGKIVSLNSQARDLIGPEGGETTGMELGALLKILGENKQDITQELIGGAFQAGELGETCGRATVLSPDGREIPVSYTVLPGGDQREMALLFHKLDKGLQNAGSDRTPAAPTAGKVAQAGQDSAAGAPKKTRKDELKAILRRGDFSVAAAIVVDHVEYFHRRFGGQAVEEIVSAYEQQIAQDLPSGGELCRWTPVSFILVMAAENSTREAERELQGLTANPLNYYLRTRNASSLLRVTAQSSIITPGEPGAVLAKIDLFVRKAAPETD